MKAKDLLTKAKAGLILDQPFYASILLKLKMEEDRTTPRIWIDGKSIGYNAAFIESQPLEIVKGILAHEVSHIIFLHHLRRKDRDFETWNDSADHAINPIIENAGFKLPPERLSDRRFFGKPTEDIFNTLWGERPAPTESPAPQPQEDPEGSQEDKAPGEGSGNGEKTESPQKGNEPGDQPGEAQESQGKEETPNNDQPQGQDGKGQGKGQGEAQEGKDQGNGNGSGPTGGNAQGTGNANGDRPADQQQQPAPPEYSDPGKTGEVRDYPDPDPTAQRQAEEEIKVEIIQSAQYAKKHGKLPAELERYIQELLNPVLPWKEILARFVDQVSRNDYSWTRPNARYMAQGFYLPALQTPEIGRIGLYIDLSGSITQQEARNMVSEQQGILTAYPGTELLVIFFNAAVIGTPETLTQYDELKEIPRPGGGTNFQPPFQYVEENQIDLKAACIFTDGECNLFPDPGKVDYPVLWILTQEPRCYPWNPPIGETTYLNPEDRTPEE